jgi:hypothetical protein
MTQVITVRLTAIYRHMLQREGSTKAVTLYRRLKMRSLAGKFEKQVERYELFKELCRSVKAGKAIKMAIEETG